MKKIHLNKTYGYLKVIEKDIARKNYYLCECQRCDKHTKKYIRKDHLISGETVSCGCLTNDSIQKSCLKNRKLKNIQHTKDGILYTKCSNSNTYFLTDIIDKEIVDSHTWYENESGYICTRNNNKIIRLHRVILGLADDDENVVDHIDGNPKNNIRNNLRICSQKENMRNLKLRSNNTTGYTGVSFDKRSQKYNAYITHDKKRYSLGYYEKLDDAINARKSAENDFGFITRI